MDLLRKEGGLVFPLKSQLANLPCRRRGGDALLWDRNRYFSTKVVNYQGAVHKCQKGLNIFGFAPCSTQSYTGKWWMDKLFHVSRIFGMHDIGISTYAKIRKKNLLFGYTSIHTIDHARHCCYLHWSYRWRPWAPKTDKDRQQNIPLVVSKYHTLAGREADCLILTRDKEGSYGSLQMIVWQSW